MIKYNLCYITLWLSPRLGCFDPSPRSPLPSARLWRSGGWAALGSSDLLQGICHGKVRKVELDVRSKLKHRSSATYIECEVVFRRLRNAVNHARAMCSRIPEVRLITNGLC